MNLDNRLEQYILDHSDQQDELLAMLEKETYLNALNPNMLSGHLQGSILTMISKMIRPKNILEIGTYTGYSAICLCRGLQPGGHMVTIEINDELEGFAANFIKKAGFENLIQQKIGPALEIIPQLEGPFDMVFMDADKREYIKYFEAVFQKVAPGGWILADNTLWGGKVISNSNKHDPMTAGIKEFNAFIAKNTEVEKLILPLRDGISIIRKK